MRTQEERIRQLHIRASGMQKQIDRRKTAGLGGFCNAVFALLLICMIRINSSLQNVMNINMQGSSLLSESAGGYVLIAVIFFMLGVLISVLLIRYQRRHHRLNGAEVDDRQQFAGNRRAVEEDDVLKI